MFVKIEACNGGMSVGLSGASAACPPPVLFSTTQRHYSWRLGEPPGKASQAKPLFAWQGRFQVDGTVSTIEFARKPRALRESLMKDRRVGCAGACFRWMTGIRGGGSEGGSWLDRP